MKTKIFFAIIGVFALALTACNPIDDNVDKNFTLNLAVTNAAAPERAVATLSVGDDVNYVGTYTVTYTVDGDSNKNIVRASGTNWKDLNGKTWPDVAANNCKSGSEIYIGLRESNVTTAYFILPLLDAGAHTLAITLTNEYGVTQNATQTFHITE